MNQVIILWKHFSTRRKKQFWLLLVLTLVASFAEMFSIGLVFPFLGVITNPEQIYQHQLIQPVIHFFSVDSINDLTLLLTIAFVLSTLFAGSIRLLLLYVTTRLSFAAGADLSIDIYKRTLYQDYASHIDLNSSEVINSIVNKTDTVITGVLNPILIFISSIVLMIGIVSILFFMDFKISSIAFFGFGLLYWLTIKITRQHLQSNSTRIAKESTKLVKALQEGLGGIRDVLLDGSQQFYCQIYRDADFPLRRASGNNIFINGSPRYIMESIGMVLIALLAYTMSDMDNNDKIIIPTLGAMALGAQRLLPVLQQAYSSYSNIKGSSASLNDVLNLLSKPLPQYADQPNPPPISFKECIHIKNISFRYSRGEVWVFKGINIKIKKGEKIGFIGKSGSGKSTLFDVIMALLRPTSGNLIVDNEIITDRNYRSWQAKISHVPQDIFLADCSIEENIAFGIPKDEINHSRVVDAARRAQISETIEGWPKKYQTFVGERGIRLSGGQKQRIGIARALYKQSSVLILDEATSALDSETENIFMNVIESIKEDITVLIIAHRLSTIQNCDRIYEIKNSNASEVIKKNK
jgi:ATP-binding cassette, subfamily B, bacterial PglK